MIKNKLFGLAMLFLSVLSYGQEFVWFENFNSTATGGLPAGWSGFDEDGNTIIPQLTDQGVTFSLGWEAVNFGIGDYNANLVSSAAFADGTGVADDWVISPSVDVDEAGMTLTWEGAIQFNGGYEVYVSTDGNNLSDFTSLSPTETISENFISADDMMTLRTLDLTPWQGETVWFAFRNNNPNDAATFGLIFIDNVGVLAAPSAIDGGVTSSPLVEYGFLAIDQAQTMPGLLNGSVQNFGANALTNVTLQLTIDSLDANSVPTNIYTAMSDPLASLASGASADLTINGSFTPDDQNENALYKFTHTIIFDEDNDDEFDDNQSGRSSYMAMTPNFTSRSAVFLDPDNDPPVDPDIDDFAIFFYASEAGTLSVGQVIEIVNPTAMDSVFVQIQDPTGETFCVLSEFDTASNTIGDVIATTESYEGMGSEGGILQGYAFDCPVELAPGFYYVGLEDPIDGSANFIFTNVYVTPNRQFLTDSEVGLDGPWDRAPVIYANFGAGSGEPLTSVEIDSDENSLSVDFLATADGLACDFAWDFGDETTGSGAAPTHNYAEEGTYTVCVTVTNDSGEEATMCEDVTVSCDLLVEVDEATPTSIELEVENAVGDVTYSWSNGQNTNPITGLQQNTEYTVTVTDEAGCSSMLSVSTTGCALTLTLSEITNSSVSAVVNGANGAFSFVWTNTTTGETFQSTSSFEQNLAAGTWLVVATDDSNCNVQESI